MDTDDRAALEAYGRGLVDGADGLVLVPIRHHSPACALHLARALDAVRPRALMIEMPGDFAPLLPAILDPATRAPVAAVAVAEGAGERPSVLGYWPLSATSPELVALRWAGAAGIPVVMGDLPTTVRLARAQDTPEPVLLADDGALTYSDYSRGLVARVGARDYNEVWDRLFESRAAETDWRGFFRDLGVECALVRRTATAAAMAADGSLAREARMRAALAEAAAVPGTGPVLAVTGGFHTPVLRDKDAAVAATEAPVPSRVYLVRHSHAHLDRMNGYASGMPSPLFYERLHGAVAALQPPPGHAIAAPGPQPSGSVSSIGTTNAVIGGLDPAIHAVTHTPQVEPTQALDASPCAPDRVNARVKHGHDGTGEACAVPGQGAASPAADPFLAVATDVLLALAARLRRDKPGFVPPLPTLAAAVAQAQGLAALRGLPGPGRCEVWDAARSCFLKGEDPRYGSPVLDALAAEMTGNAIGDVPRGTGSPPLVEAARRDGLALGFKVEDGMERRRDLDIHRKPRHRAASRFLHTMALLDTGFGRRVQGPDWTAGRRAGLLFESWDCAWSPVVEGRLVALSVDGDTPARVAASLLAQRARALADTGQDRDSDAAARLLLLAAQAGVTAAHAPLLALLADSIAADPDFARVVRCFGVLDGLWGGRAVLGLTGATALEPLRAACFRRTIDLLPTLADTAPERAADVARALAGLHHLLDAAAQAATGDALDRDLLDEGVAALLDRDLPPVVGGTVGALAFLAGRLPAPALASRVCGALAGAAAAAADRAAPLAGLLAVQPALLRHCPEVLAGTDAAFGSMDEDAFLAVLPHLRLALAALDPHETDDLAERVATLHGLAGPLLPPGNVDVTEAEMLFNAAQDRVLAELLAADGLAEWAA